MEIRFKVIEEDKLLIQKFSGFFLLEDYSRHTAMLMKNINPAHVNKILIDFRELKFDEEYDMMKEIDSVTQIRKKIANIEAEKENVKHVFWVNQPFPTVIAHLFAERLPHLSYSYCSTLNSVISKLKLPEKYLDLETIIENLE